MFQLWQKIRTKNACKKRWWNWLLEQISWTFYLCIFVRKQIEQLLSNNVPLCNFLAPKYWQKVARKILLKLTPTLFKSIIFWHPCLEGSILRWLSVRISIFEQSLHFWPFFDLLFSTFSFFNHFISAGSSWLWRTTNPTSSTTPSRTGLATTSTRSSTTWSLREVERRGLYFNTILW